MHVTLTAHYPDAGHHQPMLLPETPGYSQASHGQSLMGWLLLSPGTWCTQGFVFVLLGSVSPVLCKFCSKIPLPSKVKSSGVLSPFARSPGWEIFVGPSTFLTVQEFVWHNYSAVCGSSAWWLYGRINGNILQEGLCHRLCDPGSCTQSPCLLQQPLLTHTSARDSKSLMPQILSIVFKS